jgi:hypothetical protein
VLQKNISEYPIQFYGLVIGIVPAHFSGKNGTRHLLRAFGTIKMRIPQVYEVPPAPNFRRLLAGHWAGRS